jgi:putative cardiolipin synthase
MRLASRQYSGAGAIVASMFRALHALALGLALAGCVGLPTEYPRKESFAFADTSGTRLGRWLAPLLARQAPRSGVHPLESGLDAFVARMVLAETAERSLDLQYYIWHGDATGRLLLDAARRAADRGVRVRLLLDDIGTAADDAALLMIDAHPNVEVRLFNPLAQRRLRVFGMLADAGRTTRRMHNKSFTADNQSTIVGGRNIGDEYFAAREDVQMRDFDVVAVGPVVAQASAAFDLYWNSPMSYPIGSLAHARPSTGDLEEARRRLDGFVAAERDGPYLQALRNSRLAVQLRAGALDYFWGEARMVYDDPAKAAAQDGRRDADLLPTLRAQLAPPASELLIVSPYFVPGEDGTAALRQLRAKGVRVRVLTNSLAATDVVAVHSGYQRYRAPLLEAGVELYEMRPTAKHEADEAAKAQGGRADGAHGVSGSSRAALHAKTIALDRRTLFVGSLNLDPRSAFLNTENGVVLEMPELLRDLAGRLDAQLDEATFRVTLVPRGETQAGAQLRWIAREDGREVTYDREPAASFWRRLGAALFSLLPIESQL